MKIKRQSISYVWGSVYVCVFFVSDWECVRHVYYLVSSFFSCVRFECLSEAVHSERIQNFRCILIKSTNFEKSIHGIRCGDFQIGCCTCHINDHISIFFFEYEKRHQIQPKIQSKKNVDLLCTIIELFAIFLEFFNGNLSLTAKSCNWIRNHHKHIDFFLCSHGFDDWPGQTLVCFWNLSSIKTKGPH